MKKTFNLRKMSHVGAPELQYKLGEIPLNDLVGSEVSLSFTGKIACIGCGRDIKKTFNQGYCYPCFTKLAACDMCILKPELCHYRKGTCREPEWGKENCLIDHVVYLANTTGLKVGITRGFKKLERWGDQGAVAAIHFAIVPERYVAGLLEVELKKHVSDKADWRELLKGVVSEVDLEKEKARLSELLPDEFKQYLAKGGEFDSVLELRYPVKKYLEKAVTHSPEKDPVVKGELQGIRGQYLFIGGKAINIRKYGGYEIEFEG